MSELVSFYKQQAQNALSEIPWLASLQAQAVKNLERRGFPTRHHEEWKYTSVDSLLKHNFSYEVDDVSTAEFKSDIPAAQKLLIQNGQVFGVEALLAKLPKGVLILPLARALREQADLVKPY